MHSMAHFSTGLTWFRPPPFIYSMELVMVITVSMLLGMLLIMWHCWVTHMDIFHSFFSTTKNPLFAFVSEKIL